MRTSNDKYRRYYVFFSTFPLLIDSAAVLMQRTPIEIQRQLPIAYQRVSIRDYLDSYS